MVFYDAVTALVDRERATAIIYLELCEAFNIVLHDSLFPNWRDVDLMDGPLGVSIRNWLDGIQRVVISHLP